MRKIFGIIIFVILLFPTWGVAGSRGTYTFYITAESGTTISPNQKAWASSIYLGDKDIDGEYYFSFISIGGVTQAGTSGITVFYQSANEDNDSTWALSGISYFILGMDCWSGATKHLHSCAPTGGLYYRMGYESGNTIHPVGRLNIR